MYELRVFHTGRTEASETLQFSRGGEVLEAIPALLARYPDCAHIAVYLDATRLFAVDCAGNQIPFPA